MIVEVRENGFVEIPDEFLKKLDIKLGDELELIEDEEKNQIIIQKKEL